MFMLGLLSCIPRAFGSGGAACPFPRWFFSFAMGLWQLLPDPRSSACLPWGAGLRSDEVRDAFIIKPAPLITTSHAAFLTGGGRRRRESCRGELFPMGLHCKPAEQGLVPGGARAASAPGTSQACERARRLLQNAKCGTKANCLSKRTSLAVWESRLRSSRELL